MRRIYESDALRRGEEPHEPSDEDDDVAGNRLPTMLDWGGVSKLFVPTSLRDRAITVDVETERETYAPGEPVAIRVRMRNRAPVPIAIPTPTPVRWDWTVDGVRQDARVDDVDPPDRKEHLTFARSETKAFSRTWRQTFKTGDREWTDAEEGRHEIAAFVDVDSPEERGLYASAKIEIRP
ncbi:hypothetical protein ACFQDG_06745 [Natronoarchaeum mannanilyticum]|uniref:DUF7974 domain-containing protein n=1 Tax=Natronoarchaeum mannanilyticum TaxID=926360 RepID=A0AAV3TAA1_9EURY